MTRWLLLASATLLAGTCAAGARWAQHPVMARPNAECASCHAGSALPDHTPRFVAETHGPAAQRERERCAGCHRDEQADCTPCHARTLPEWHTQALRAPGRGHAPRDEHARVARARRASCAECHAATFRTRCASCHRPSEDWLEEAAP